MRLNERDSLFSDKFRFLILESSVLMACPFANGPLNLCIGISQIALFQFYYYSYILTHLHLLVKVENLIEFSIFYCKTGASFELEVEAIIRLIKQKVAYIYKNTVAKLRMVMNFSCEHVLYVISIEKILILKTFHILPQANQKSQDFGGRPSRSHAGYGPA